jgi:hypothetical protein
MQQDMATNRSESYLFVENLQTIAPQLITLLEDQISLLKSLRPSEALVGSARRCDRSGVLLNKTRSEWPDKASVVGLFRSLVDEGSYEKYLTEWVDNGFLMSKLGMADISLADQENRPRNGIDLEVQKKRIVKGIRLTISQPTPLASDPFRTQGYGLATSKTGGAISSSLHKYDTEGGEVLLGTFW